MKCHHLREPQLAMKTIYQIRSKCHSTSLGKDLPKFVNTEYERPYYDGYIKALMWGYETKTINERN